MTRTALLGLCALSVCVIFHPEAASAQPPSDVVLYASDAAAMKGNWSRISDPSAAGGQAVVSNDNGWTNPDAAAAAPPHSFDFTFAAPANIPYRIWLRLKAKDNSKYNDSVFAQFSDAVSNGGAPLYRIGTATGLSVNLQSCDGCPLSGWGWLDGAYWLQQSSTVRFASNGPHTLRIQIREDGVRLDQVVISPSNYLLRAPGPVMNDAVIVPKAAPAGSTPVSGTPIAVPGTIKAESFDNGGEGLAYHDLTAANEGGVYRQSGVDLAATSEGGYCLGWVAASEWLNYSVDVSSAGSYLLEARVASLGQGGSFHVNVGSVNATGALVVPNTGGWQNWATISKVVSLPAGAQVLRVVFDTAGANAVGNLAWLRLTRQSASGGTTPYSGTPVALPGTLRASDFDKGGEGAAYHDTTTGNSGGQYRTTDVDIETSSGGGANIGYVANGEWLTYSVNVATAGQYAVRFKVAAPGNQGRLRAMLGGATTPSVTVPNTGGWQNWTDVSTSVNLAAGPQMLTVVADVGGFNISQLTVAAAAPTQPDPPTSPIISVAAGGDLQDAINRANPGDTIVLQAGATFTGNFVLPAKSGSSYITIRSSTPDASLPGDNSRIGPAHAPLLAKIRSSNNMSALVTAPSAHHYRLQFLEFLANRPAVGDIIALGDGSPNQNGLSVIPHDLILDRVYIHGDATLGQKRAISLNSATTTIVNSYISDIKAAGQDSQAIAGWNGPGPYTITNNYLEAAGENVMFGGADPKVPNLVPSDITIRKNVFSKQLAWRTQGWSVKNLLELKNAQRVVVEGNAFENNWAGEQAGFAIVFTPRNQDGTAPWSVVQDVRFTNNTVWNVGAGINLLGSDNIKPSQRTNGIVISNNLFGINMAQFGGAGRFALLNGPDNVTFDHNTVFSDGSSTVYADSQATTRLVFTNNVIPDNAYGIMGSDASPGNGTIARYFPGGVFIDNVFAGSLSSRYPPNNYFPPTMAAVGFVDVANGNYALGVSSPYRNAASDGTDVGCDMNAMTAAMR